MVYLVDFENVTSAGISGIQRLTKEDKVYIFYTVNASNMSFAAHLNLLSSPAEIIYYNVASGGKNALDFQLSSFLGYLISKGEEKNFCIISNDKGYEYVRMFWEKNGLAAGISINSSPSINRALLPAERPFTAKIQQGGNGNGNGNNQMQIDPAGQAAQFVQFVQFQPEEAAEIPEKEPVQEVGGIPADGMEEISEKKPKKRGRPKGKKSVTDSGANTAVNLVKQLLAKAGVTDADKAAQVTELLRRTAGKQQFYRSMLTIFGMEKGVVVYKTIRTEYTNLTKLVKQ